MIQFTALISVAEEELITKEVPAVIVPTDKSPQTAHPAPDVSTPVNKIMEFAVTAVVLTVIVPAVIAPVVPALALEPVAILSLLPAVIKARLPVTSTLSVGTVVDPNPNAPTCVLVVFEPVWLRNLVLLLEVAIVRALHVPPRDVRVGANIIAPEFPFAPPV